MSNLDIISRIASKDLINHTYSVILEEIETKGCQRTFADGDCTFSFLIVQNGDEYGSFKLIEQEDIYHLISTLEKMSKTPLKNLIDEKNRLHFHPFKKEGGKKKIHIKLYNPKTQAEIKDKYDPPMYSFAIYPPEKQAEASKINEKASEDSKVKNPRIIATIGQEGILYICLYDPYHQMV